MDLKKLRSIINDYKSPVYVYDGWKIRENAIKLKKTFSKFKIYYSIKANPNIEVCRLISKLNFEAEVVTKGELEIAIKAWFRVRNILFAWPCKIQSHIKFAIVSWIRLFTAESINQMRLINSIAKIYKCKVKVIIRINEINLYSNAWESMMWNSQFGMDTDSIIKSKDEINNLTNITIIGTQFYASSQILDTKKLSKSVKYQLSITKKLQKHISMEIGLIDIWWWFWIPYKENEKELNIKWCAMLVNKELKNTKLIFDEIAIESGRYLVGNAWIFLTKIIDIKENFWRTYAICDGWMVWFTRPILVESHKIRLIKFNKRKLWSNKENVVVCWPSCSSMDILGEFDMSYPDIGDIILIENAGAYWRSMSIHYFHCMKPPIEIFLPII